jgi:protein-disulfide isomerase-like protein with CxxC motif
MKKILINAAVWVLIKFAPDALVAAQEAMYQKGKNSGTFKQLTEVGQKVGNVLKTVADAGADGVFTDEERAASREMWEDITTRVANVISGGDE